MVSKDGVIGEKELEGSALDLIWYIVPQFGDSQAESSSREILNVEKCHFLERDL
jgi:hypothetical protein